VNCLEPISSLPTCDLGFLSFGVNAQTRFCYKSGTRRGAVGANWAKWANSADPAMGSVLAELRVEASAVGGMARNANRRVEPRCAPSCRGWRKSHFWRQNANSLRRWRLIAVFEATNRSCRDKCLRNLMMCQTRMRERARLGRGACGRRAWGEEWAHVWRAPAPSALGAGDG
jgi:hypothetical protein